MKRLSLFTFFLATALFSFSLTESSCTGGHKTSVEKRIKKQKKRQKRNPGDCPRIDC